VSEITAETELRRQIGEWIAAGTRVVGPRRVTADLVLYDVLESPDQLLTQGFVRPANSIKEFLFPKAEKLYGYRIQGNQIALVETEPPEFRQIIVAARPCDAASLPILDPLFNWDFHDEFYNRRREATTVITLACAAHDDSCFCTSVGLGPECERGSDAMLLALDNGNYEVRRLTDKGRALFNGKTQESERSSKPHAGPDRRFDSGTVGKFAADNFESPFWQEHALTCMGCGACAFTCPSCHCFDIVDAGVTTENARIRTWDSCQFSTFTVHASGHNPRPTQPSRQRQRILHKFAIYPEKFGEILCTGCGNCTRNCPVGLGVLSVATEIDHG
jgi:ferredoxin